MNNSPIDVFIDLPSSPGPVPAGRLWAHFHHVTQHAFHVTHPSEDKKNACPRQELTRKRKFLAAIADYPNAGVSILAGAAVPSSSRG